MAHEAIVNKVWTSYDEHDEHFFLHFFPLLQGCNILKANGIANNIVDAIRNEKVSCSPVSLQCLQQNANLLLDLLLVEFVFGVQCHKLNCFCAI